MAGHCCVAGHCSVTGSISYVAVSGGSIRTPTSTLKSLVLCREDHRSRPLKQKGHTLNSLLYDNSFWTMLDKDNSCWAFRTTWIGELCIGLSRQRLVLYRGCSRDADGRMQSRGIVVSGKGVLNYAENYILGERDTTLPPSLFLRGQCDETHHDWSWCQR